LFGKSNQSPREAHYYFSGYKLQAIRQGPWKLAIKPQLEAKGEDVVKDDGAKSPRLYNLDSDIGERINIADKHPDIVAKLQALAEKMDAEITANRRPAGEAANPQTLYPSGPKQ
jgi:arylsulfatase A-like enzyme